MRDEQNREIKRAGKNKQRREIKTEGKKAQEDRPDKKAVPNKVYKEKSDGSAKGFGRAVGVTWTMEDSSKSHSQSRDVC